jgi:cytochrome c peroxidase
VLRGLLPVTAPANNPPSAAKTELGKMLFFDTRLSDRGQFACAVCHMPEKGWGDGIKKSTRANGTVNTRHSPTMYNIFYSGTTYYWDGRKDSVEATSEAAMMTQMSGDPVAAATKLALVPEYKKRFTEVFGSGPTGPQISQALGAFIRTIQSGDAPWDRFQAGDKTAVTQQVIDGEAVFRKANCTNCHVPPLYSDYLFHNTGVGYEANAMPDLGRGKINMVDKDNGAFKTPPLRSVSTHPPHLHDGSAATLEAAMDFMLAGGYRVNNPNIDPLIRPQNISPTERSALLAFLRSLTPVENFQRPTIPLDPVAAGGGATAPDQQSGKQLYDNLCAVCHGDNGKGLGGFPDTTVASLKFGYPTRDSLVAKIARSMPTSRPGTCTGTCAEKTADYILSSLPGETAPTSGGGVAGGGTGGTAGGGTAGGGTAGGGAGGEGSAGAGTGTTEQLVCVGAEKPGRRVLRLLTQREYENTVLDLLGVSTPLSASLPVATRVVGYDNNVDVNVVTARHLEAYLNAGEDLAKRAVQSNRAKLLGCDPAQNATACATQFVGQFGKKAYRRPITAPEQDALVKVFSAAPSFDDGLRTALTAILVSPNFLYRSELGTQNGNTFKLTPYETATALSYLFWGTTPDAPLLLAADNNQLQTPEQLTAQANRLLADAKAKRQIGVFAGQWLGADPQNSGDKDRRVYPDYTPAVQDASDQELVAFVNHVIFTGTGKFPELYQANYVFANQPLAAYYGLGGVNGNNLQQVQVPNGTRGGVLGLASVLASFAQADDSSPVKRGVFVRDRLLCQELPPPPPSVNNAPPPLDATLTTRERFAAHSQEPFCQSCHQYIDDIGFGLERYDGAGKLRGFENGAAVDDSGEIVSPEKFDPKARQLGQKGVPFKGLRELSTIIGNSEDSPRCLTKQYFRYTVGYKETANEICSVNALQAKFVASGFDLKTLLIGIVQSPVFTQRSN